MGIYSEISNISTYNLSLLDLRHKIWEEKLDKSNKEVYFRNTENKDKTTFFEITDVKVENDKDGKTVIVLLPSNKYSYKVTPIEVKEEKSILT